MASAVELMEQAMEQAPNVEQVASTLLETDGVAGVMATIAAGKIHDGDHHLLLTCYTALFVDGPSRQRQAHRRCRAIDSAARTAPSTA